MERYLIILLLLIGSHGVSAQRISRQYNNVSMAQALKELNHQQNRYTVNFIYNDLEDFRVTTNIKNKSVPDAIEQLIGFYPIRMTRRGDVIMVECTHKTRRHLTGKVIDETGLPVPYANVLLLSVADSSAISGGVTNESGIFVVPFEPSKVIARISYVGYKPVYRTFSTEQAGIIQLQPDALKLKEVTIKTSRPLYKQTSGGMSINVENSLLSKLGTAMDVLGQLPRVTTNGDNVQVFAKGTPLIYVNNRRISDMKKLTELKSDNIKSVEVITSPGAQYDAQVQSVIRIKTIRRQADGLSFRNDTRIEYNGQWTGSEATKFTYRTKHWELFNNLTWMNYKDQEKNYLCSQIHTSGEDIETQQHIRYEGNHNLLSENIGASYLINDSNTIGGAYRYYTDYHMDGSIDNNQNIYKNGTLEGTIAQKGDVEVRVPARHQADLYYVGRLGKLSIDFNASYMSIGTKERHAQSEHSNEFPNREVHSTGNQHSNLWAGKLVLSHPLWGGNIYWGTELSSTNSRGDFNNKEQIVAASETNIKERYHALFTEYTHSFGNFILNTGLRYEHVTSDYYSFGVKQADASKHYSNLFPSFSLSWNHEKWSFQLNYSNKIHRPSYRSLRNFIQYNNRYAYEGGNPELHPEQIHNVEINGIYRWLSLSIGYKYNKDVMFWSHKLYNNQAISFSSTYNYDHSENLYASISASPKFGIYQPTAEINYIQQRFHAPLDNGTLVKNNPCFAISLRNQFAFSNTFIARVDFRARTKIYDGFQTSNGWARMNLAFRKTFYNNRLIFILSADDIFKSEREQWTLRGYGTTLDKDCYNYTRAVSLTVTYNFNAKRSKYKGTGAGNAEKSRL
ncbi:TonB-dependent receptor domain-containing protein [Prevotella jejuni]|uniref:TonB-dependent receptor domain-containing protein n=1 Tax=Prevotella jejuni TaxID=1177574 RepID=UPI003C717D31